MQKLADIKDILDLPQRAVVALINVEDRKVYISYAHSILSHSRAIYEQMRTSSNSNRHVRADARKLQYVILEPTEDMGKWSNVYARACIAEWIESAEMAGWTVYNTSRPHVLYYDMQVEYPRKRGLPRVVVTVYIRSKDRKPRKVGSYATVIEADNICLQSIRDTIHGLST